MEGTEISADQLKIGQTVMSKITYQCIIIEKIYPTLIVGTIAGWSAEGKHRWNDYYDLLSAGKRILSFKNIGIGINLLRLY